MSIEPEDIKRAYDLESAPVNDTVLGYSLVADNEANPEAKEILVSSLLTSVPVSGQAALNNFQGLTSKGFADTTATPTRAGIAETSTAQEGIDAIATNKIIVPSILDAIFEARFAKTKTYVLADFDLPGSSNVSSMVITDFSEMVVGKYTDMGGEFEVVISAEVPNIEIVLNATQTPLHIKGCSAALLADTTRWIAQAGTITTFSGSKLKIIIGKADNTSFGAGTYKFSVGLNYYSV